MEYNYPLNSDWSTEEMVAVVQFFEVIEKAYESKVKASDVKERYLQLRAIIPSKAEEKTIFRDFEKASSYNSYRVVQLALKEDSTWIKMSSQPEAR